MKETKVFAIYVIMIITGLIIVNVGYRTFEFGSLKYWWSGSLGLGLAISGFGMFWYYTFRKLWMIRKKLNKS